MAVAVLVVALPTALRPPQQPPNTSAELSPDAPPDPDQESIVAALNRGTSATAGAGTGEGSSDGAGPGGGPPPTPPPALAPPRFCPHGFGVPPRQVESWYAAPCAGSWQGDNGGATWKGVTGGEIRIVLANDGIADEGEVPSEPQADESDPTRTSRILLQYFNQNYQFWGRRLRIFARTIGEGEEAARAAVVQADEEDHAFLVQSGNATALEEAARRQMIGFGGYNHFAASRYYTSQQPYVFGWSPDGDYVMRYTAEYVCKKLAGKPAIYARGADEGKRRRFGFLYISESDNRRGGTGFSSLPGLVKEQCGEEVVPQSYDATDSTSYSNDVATGVARFRTQGVTSIVVATDPLFLPTFLQQADAQSYFPEWINTGYWLTDHNYIPSMFGFSKAQWSRAIGFATKSMTEVPGQTDWYRAYKSLDPHNEPYFKAAFYFPVLMQIANAIQLAGPNLTPESFQQGLFKMGIRRSEPHWLVGGGYAPGHLTYSDDIAEVYWDPAPMDPSGIGDLPPQPGVWRYVRCGQRYRVGEIPREDPHVFAGGCITPAG